MATVTGPSPFRLSARPTASVATTIIQNCIHYRSHNPSLQWLTNKVALSRSFRAGSIPSSVSKRSSLIPYRLAFVVPLASQGDSNAEQAVQDPEIEDSSDGKLHIEDSAAAEEEIDGVAGSDSEAVVEESDTSCLVAALKSYKEALSSDDVVKIDEIESFLKLFEDEKSSLESKLSALTVELSAEKDRVLRISADFDNFRKRTERERLSLVTNAKGEVVENLLGVLDNFERAKAQIKIETEGEEKINNSYQSIYKQFVEILVSLGVVPVETVGKPFDPMLHEAIMREDSSDFEEGIILEEFRKGFKIGERLLRPSMVKVSAGPGPAQSEDNMSDTSSDSASESMENVNPAADSP